MNTDRRIAVSVGVLYIIGTVAGILSVIFTGPFQDEADFLVDIADNESQIVIGALLVLAMGLALAMIPVVVYPVLEKHNKILALGYVVFRGALESFTYLMTVFATLLLLPLSHEFVEAGRPDDSHFEAFGNVLLEAKEISSLTTFVFIIGAVMFYYVLYKANLIPRWLSGWGLVGAIPYVTASFLVLFDATDHMSTLDTVLRVPLGLQEMVLAVWLIAKGFNSVEATSP
jgi:hypothetical protein